MSKIDLQKIKTIYTHDGCFHTDDVISTVLLQEINPNLKVCRVSEITDEIRNNPENLIFDIGDGEYDHHQEDRRYNERGEPYSAFGLLWRDFGREYLQLKGFKNIEEAYEDFNESYVYAINVGDNTGYQNVSFFRDNLLVKSFNAKWYELKERDIQDEQFYKAVNFAKGLFENWTRQIFEGTEWSLYELNLWQSEARKSKDGIVVLEDAIPWREYLEDNKFNIRIVITKNERGGYNVSSVDTDKIKIQKNEYLSFVHPSSFMGIANTLDDAIMASKKIIREGRNIAC